MLCTACLLADDRVFRQCGIVDWPSNGAAPGAPQRSSGTGEDDRARAARYLAEAMSAVPSIGSDFARAYGPAALARVLARIDLDRSAGLAAEAERIARSLTSPGPGTRWSSALTFSAPLRSPHAANAV